jgi:hypothetical protein
VSNDPNVEIRRVDAEEWHPLTVLLHGYAFGESPLTPDQSDSWREGIKYREDETRIAAFVKGEPAAAVVGMPMRQNVRGLVVPMLGVSGVATHPTARRQGHVRTLLTQLHGDMRDSGHVTSTLYPFRESFYERFGYVGFPKARSIRLRTDGLTPLLKQELPGEVTFHRIGAAFDEYYAATEVLLGERHGFGRRGRKAAQQVGDEDKHWIVFARHEGEVVGVFVYRTLGHGAVLEGKALLYRTPVGRALLLQWLARHLEFDSFTFQLPPDDRPDVWYTDLAYSDETRVQAPSQSAPMGRVLSVPGLSGMSAGSASIAVRIDDDPFVGGTWTLSGTGGVLEVKAGGTPTVQLTSHGLAALVYGVLDPVDLSLRGYGEVSNEAAVTLRTLFPPATPYLFEGF